MYNTRGMVKQEILNYTLYIIQPLKMYLKNVYNLETVYNRNNSDIQLYIDDFVSQLQLKNCIVKP